MAGGKNARFGKNRVPETECGTLFPYTTVQSFTFTNVPDTDTVTPAIGAFTGMSSPNYTLC